MGDVPRWKLKLCLCFHCHIIFSMVGLLAQGKSDFEHIEAHRQDEFFKYALNLKGVPSCSRMRQRLDLLAKNDEWRACILRETALLPGKMGVMVLRRFWPALVEKDMGFMPNSYG